MRPATQRLLVGAVVAVLLAAAACSSSDARTPAPSAVALVDGSTSTADPHIASRHLADFKLVIDWIGKREGVLFADIAGVDALATATVPVSVDFAPGENVPNNPFYTDLNLKKKREEALKQAHSMFDQIRAHPVNESDIVSAVVAAARLFAARGRTGQRLLVIQSDMTQYGGQAGDFYTENLSDPVIKSKVADLRKGGMVPDLEGVTVLVSGAGVAADARLDQRRLIAIEHFWRSYFRAAGATIPPGGYGARLVALPS